MRYAMDLSTGLSLNETRKVCKLGVIAPSGGGILPILCRSWASERSGWILKDWFV